MVIKSRAAFTLIEMLVVIAIIATIAAFALPAITGALTRGQLTQAVSNARQVHLATFAMATDGTQTGDAKYGWPGDLAASTEPTVQITTVSQFVQRLVDNDYLKPGDLKVFATAGITPWNGRYIPPAGTNGIGSLEPVFNGTSNCAFKIYQVKESDGANVIFLATRNFTYSDNPAVAISTAPGMPFGDKGFVVFHKGGDGTFYKRQQATSKALLGVLPGQTDTIVNEDLNSTLQQ
jgi:prepilin-type N-terminal cleavage/methylation domain-containing protein